MVTIVTKIWPWQKHRVIIVEYVMTKKKKLKTFNDVDFVYLMCLTSGYFHGVSLVCRENIFLAKHDLCISLSTYIIIVKSYFNNYEFQFAQ